MQQLSLLSQVVLYVAVNLLWIVSMLLWSMQIQILRGGSFQNPDGSRDDWHEQKMFYGIAFADVFVACPSNIAGIILVFLYPRWGYYLLALVSFWWVWANVMTTATSLRFCSPKQHFMMWLVGYPFGILLGLAYIAWTIVHFEYHLFLSLRGQWLSGHCRVAAETRSDEVKMRTSAFTRVHSGSPFGWVPFGSDLAN
jgi:hypothetical protein